MKINVISRKSELALWQTRFVAESLTSEGHEIALATMETMGDLNLDAPIPKIAKIGGKGIFTAELEKKLLAGESDIAVHSAKDMQSTLPAGLEIIAFTKREKAHDILISDRGDIDISDKTRPLRIGTSSARRKAFLKKYYPSVEIIDVRGNLQTRIKKMRQGLCDALLLAYAGVARMGFGNMIIHEFPLDQFIPPVGQGTIAVEAAMRLDWEKKAEIRRRINHGETEICLLAERAFLQKMKGGCSIPVFAHAIAERNGIRLNAGIASLNGEKMIVREKKILSLRDVEAALSGALLAEEILNLGGDEILAEILHEMNVTTA
ncbi:MAG: hydroxymethylbilane synthase [Desulfobulbaceae bacterium]|jgi:hydroxymethylbilane synthase|nr:hydroxymethylbilane synthase [Desulfobulbaceae bacterium]